MLSVNLMVNYLYRKYGVQIHIFSPKMGPEVQTTLSVNLEMWKIHYYHLFIYSENTNSNLCCPLLWSFWQRRVQHKLEFWHDEYTFVIDSGHFLFQFANRLFHVPIWALVHFNGILSKFCFERKWETKYLVVKK